MENEVHRTTHNKSVGIGFKNVLFSLKAKTFLRKHFTIFKMTMAPNDFNILLAHIPQHPIEA